jgi:hypothetical protein
VGRPGTLRRSLLLALLAGGCVDLSLPPALTRVGGPSAGDARPDDPDAGDLPDGAPPPLDRSPEAGQDAAAGGALEVHQDGAPGADARQDAVSGGPDAGQERPPGPADATTADAITPPSPDGGACTGPSCGLVVDDFQDGTFTPNALGSPVTEDNQTCSVSNGEIACSWNGRSTYQDLIETLQGWCELDATAYTRLRFKMRASAPGKSVKVYVGVSRGACVVQKPLSLVATVTAETTMTSHDVDLSALPRDRLIFIEFDPVALDSTQYFWDDLQLVP